MRPNPPSKSNDSEGATENADHPTVKAAQKIVDAHLASKQVSGLIVKEKFNLRTELDNLISKSREDKDSDLEQYKEELLKQIALINNKHERALRNRSGALATMLKTTKMLLGEHYNALLAECDTKESCVAMGGKWCEARLCPENDGSWCDSCCIPPDQDC